MTSRKNPAHESMTIVGRLEAELFVSWIRRHAARLGLRERVRHADAERIELTLSGPVELIDMLELGCWLGPIEVWVETIRRRPHQGESSAAEGHGPFISNTELNNQ